VASLLLTYGVFAAGVHVRYVVANPWSYLYFSNERPTAPVSACPKVDEWKYGWAAAPAYALDQAPQAYEATYVQRHVIYLLLPTMGVTRLLVEPHSIAAYRGRN